MPDISVEQWIALNDEVASLVRSGLPLEQGLLGMAEDTPGRLGSVASSLARRLEQGATLTEALDAEGDLVPPVYRAVVEAGARSGRLASALEGLAEYARGYVEMRRMIGTSMLYPIIVISLAYALLIGFLVVLVPTFVSVFDEFRLPAVKGMRLIEPISDTVRVWWPVGPVLLLVVLLAWWRTGRSWSFPGDGHGPLLWVPWLRDLVRLTTWSAFADLLALLIEHEVPLPNAISLAGRASGDAGLMQASSVLAAEVERGERTPETAGLPPMVAWLLKSGRGDSALVKALRQTAEGYKRRADLQAVFVRTTLPVLFLLAVGGVSVLVYALCVFVPLTVLWDQLANKVG